MDVYFFFRERFCKDFPQQSIEFIIGTKIAYYVTPVIIGLGIVGNTLSFSVAMLKHNRSLPFGIYMAALACSDTFLLTVGQLYGWIMFHFLSLSMNKAKCQALLFLYQLGGNVGAWIIVALTFERYLLVCRATDHVRFRTVRNTYITVAIIVLVCIAKNIHYIFTAEFIADEGHDFMICAIGFERSDATIIFVQVVEMLFNSLIPFICILTLNGFIIYRLRKQANTRKKRLRNNTAASSVSMLSSKTPRDSARGLTVMLVSVSMAFVCLTSPMFIYRFYFAFEQSACNEPKTLARYILVDNVLMLLYGSNFSINLLLYCVTGSLFREDLINIFKTLSEWLDITYYVKHALHMSNSFNLKSGVSKRDNIPQMTSFTNISELKVASLVKWTSCNTLRSKQNGHHHTENIFSIICLHEIFVVCLEVYLQFVSECPVGNGSALVQITTWL